MERISIDDLPAEPYDENLHTDRRDLTEPLSLEGVSMVQYALEPGERFSGAAHAHPDQEEVFVVLEGEATFEVGRAADDDGPRTVRIGENEAIRFAPGEFQTGWNDVDDRLVALALGAPRESEDVRVDRIPVLGEDSVTCPDCGHDHARIGDEGLVCPDCGASIAVDE
ncbi:cupin domain-containing protein [Natronobacterium texcoconense]|uniref:Cupin domain-containing protein n=1 Tax=Natronobacterium texcoconense TaxID=1095778 RepID=A0A1H1IAQ2_NATTX|nr:cupin domain-containing protein [Natronobacterium texcoconense]SDR34732.1 Cupin domain-containing protein [Natronobacterium texcoconense]